jgi:hypothetical protein
MASAFFRESAKSGLTLMCRVAVCMLPSPHVYVEDYVHINIMQYIDAGGQAMVSFTGFPKAASVVVVAIVIVSAQTHFSMATTNATTTTENHH